MIRYFGSLVALALIPLLCTACETKQKVEESVEQIGKSISESSDEVRARANDEIKNGADTSEVKDNADQSHETTTEEEGDKEHSGH